MPARIEKLNEEKLLDLYKNGSSILQISKKLGVSRWAVNNRLVKFGFKQDKLRAKRIDLENSEICNMYKCGLSTYKICNITGIPKSSVLNILVKENVKLRSKSESVTKYSLNHDFFGNFSPESCYWAGFIAADGCVYERDYGSSQLLVALNSKDHEHLVKFTKLIGFTGPVYKYYNTEYEGNWRSAINITSKIIAKDLKKNFNIVPRKSIILNSPNICNEEFKIHFIRGYIDGDGSYDKKKPQITIAGTDKMLKWIKEILKNNCKVGNPSICPRDNIFVITYGGGIQVPNILRLLYMNTKYEIRLDRKYDINEKYLFGGK